MRGLLLVLFTICLGQGWAQPTGISIKRTTGVVTIDAEMNEPEWGSTEVADRFKQFFPFDSAYAIAQTEVRMMYDDHFIYVYAVMHNTEPRDYVTPTLRRDFRGEAFDAFVVSLDTYMDNTNAFQFGVNPFGVQREGLISNGGATSDDLSLTWDNKWYSAARMLEDSWVCEFAIPFTSIRFKEGLEHWNINFYRIDSHYAERSTWSPIPRVFPLINLAFMRKLNWEQPLRNPGQNISLIPYMAPQVFKDFEAGLPAEKTVAVGGDAKVAVSSALNLDLTVNPDFSQVEVDQQVTNLDRFEIFFPERRQFFLENADLFADFGSENARPFFSRRIGVAVDTATGQNYGNTIYAGARLSGKINNNLRVGLMTMQAGKNAALGIPSTNYSVLSLQQKIFARSNIGLIFINKQAVADSIGGAFTMSPANFNRVVGIDYNLLSKDNKWNGKFYYHRSFDQRHTDSTFAAGGSIYFATVKWESEWVTRLVGANYNPEVGYVRRTDIRQLASTSWHNIYPAGGSIQSHGPGFDFDMVGNDKYGFLDWDVNLMYRFRFRNTAYLLLRLREEYTYLFEPFDASGSDGVKLPAGTSYKPYVFIGSFISDARKKFYVEVNTRSGQYFNGHRANLTGRVSYRFQPLGVVSMDFSYNGIRLPAPYSDADHFVIGPRLDLTFSDKVFWTTLVQYNSQKFNVGINSRLQWRFAPVSDLFLVYTDNYFAGTGYPGEMLPSGDPRLRSIVLKITYWLNL